MQILKLLFNSSNIIICKILLVSKYTINFKYNNKFWNLTISIVKVIFCFNCIQFEKK